MAMEYQWHDLVGIVGVAAIIISYLLLQLGKLDGRSLAYSAANAVGAGLVLVSLAFDFNLSAFVVESFWVIISVVGIARSIRARSKSSGAGTQSNGEGTKRKGADTQATEPARRKRSGQPE